MKNYFLALVLFILIIGCNDSSTKPDTETENSIIPLKIGNTWNYRYISIHEDGNETEYYSSYVSSKTTIDSKSCFILRDSGIEEGEEYDCVNSYLTLDNDGIRFWDDREENKLYINDFFKFPVNSGDSYSYTIAGDDIYSEVDDIIVTVNVTLTEITVPAGTFECYKYQQIYLENDEEYEASYFYLNKDVGMISFGFTPEGFGELMSYNID